jgi:hypothetical protein
MTLNMLRLGLEQIICREQTVFPEPEGADQLILLHRVSVKGTPAQEWDKNTWEPLADLARNHPEAGVHFQKCEIYNREKDVSSPTAAWFAELLSPTPWFSTLFDDVSDSNISQICRTSCISLTGERWTVMQRRLFPLRPTQVHP